jgi:hypothetical protein
MRAPAFVAGLRVGRGLVNRFLCPSGCRVRSASANGILEAVVIISWRPRSTVPAGGSETIGLDRGAGHPHPTAPSSWVRRFGLRVVASDPSAGMGLWAKGLEQLNRSCGHQVAVAHLGHRVGQPLVGGIPTPVAAVGRLPASREGSRRLER